MSELDSLQGSVATVAASVGPAVVAIGDGGRGGAGIVTASGRIVTNAHNVRGRDVDVTFADGRETLGTVVGIDVDGDLAVVSADTADVAPIAWSERPAVALGQVVVAVTNPRGMGPRVTVGTISGLQRAFRGPRGRRIGGSIEHTAPLAPGSSGSPLLDAEGRLLAINTNRLGDGFYLAIAADADLRGRLDSLARGESHEPVRLGVSVVPSRVARRLRRSVGLPERSGVLIGGVDEDGPAAVAGVVQGDLIVSAGGRAIADFDDLADALAGSAAGSSLELGIVRGVDELTVTVAFPSPGGPA